METFRDYADLANRIGVLEALATQHRQEPSQTMLDLRGQLRGLDETHSDYSGRYRVLLKQGITETLAEASGAEFTTPAHHFELAGRWVLNRIAQLEDQAAAYQLLT